mgnify:CR=1 FL=1
MNQLDPSLKVSVLVMTYNHANFIRKTIDSVLMQQVDFNYEIVISEDFSTDSTREIVIEYQEKFPEKICLILSHKNLHSNEVVARGITACKGEYIALLDGDDYWTSPHKLQKQVDFLANHPECSMCFHNATAFYEDSSKESWIYTADYQKEMFTLEDIWLGNFIATCSTMFRNRVFGEVPTWYSYFPITDWPLHILNAEQGEIGYINEVMGAYRYHQGGDYSLLSQEQKLRTTHTFYHLMNYNLEFRHDKFIQIALSNYFFEWAEEYEKRGDLESARKCFKTCLTGNPINKLIPIQKLFKMWLKFNFPQLLRFKKAVSVAEHSW